MLEWSGEYSVENKELDGEHKQLISLINNLQEQMLKEISEEGINRTIFEMLNYAEKHLSHEEELMKKAAFPGYIDHKHKHDDFRLKIKEFKKDLQNNGDAAEISRDILFFLQRWLITHIKGTDRKYIPFLSDQ